MKIVYRGFIIDAFRAKSLGGDRLLYWSIFRESDLYECDSSFTTGTDPVRKFIGYLKERVDSELKSDDPWDERASRES